MASVSAGPIRLFVLGDARIETPRGVIEPSAEVVFATALYLILEREPVSRRALEKLLWPSVQPQAASHRLRQTLHRLKGLGVDIEPVGKTRLCLARAKVETDYRVILLETERAGTLPATPLTMLPGYEPRFSSPFLEWVDDRKREITASATRVLLSLIARHRSRGQWQEVEQVATALRTIAPYNEEAALALAEAHAMRGSKLEGIRILDEYLNEIGKGPNDLRIQATLMRRRIADRLAPTENTDLIQIPLIGRAPSLHELASMLSAAKQRKGRASLILGPAGIGKSRLLAELVAFATLQGFSTQRIQCRSSHKQRPLSAFVELVPGLRSLRGAIGCSPETLSYLNRLTQHQPLEEVPRADDHDSHWVYSRVLRALFDIVDAVAEENPLLIQIEDAHWLDATSCEVLSDMMNWAIDRPVVFVLTGREPPDPWLTDLPENLSPIPLAPLDDESSIDLVLSIARRFARTIDEDYRHWCVRVGEGNPYYLQELATHWIETGHHHEVPPSLSALLGNRVDRLDIDALQVFQTCALLENNSTLRRIELLLGYEPHRFLQSMNTLGAAGMVIVEPDDPDAGARGKLTSKHELLSNVALQRLSAPAKVFLHRRIGLILEQEVDAHFSTSVLWDCAKHWQLAGDSQRALSLALSCARHLMTVGLSRAAATAYERCQSFCRTDAQRLEVLEGEVLANYRVSDWQQVREKTAIARTVKDRISPDLGRHDDLELMDLRAQWQTLEWKGVAANALECLHASDATPRHRVEGGIMAMMLLGFQSDAAAVKNAYLAVEKLIDENDLGAPARLQSQMVYHTGFGDLTLGVEAARHLLLEQDARGNVADLFRAHCNAAVTFRVAGSFDEARVSLHKALDLADVDGLDQSKVRVLPLLANMALELGRVSEAAAWYAQLASLTIHPSNRFGHLEFGGIGARLALLSGDGEKAMKCWPMTRKEAQSDPIPHRRAYNCALQIAIDLAEKGEPDLPTLECLIDAYGYSRIGVHQAFCVSVVYAALIRSGEKGRGDEILREYVTRHRREPWPMPSHLLEPLLTLGVNQQAKGRTKRAFGGPARR